MAARAACIIFAIPLLVSAADRISFQQAIRPILAERCQICHSASNRSGGLSVSAFGLLLEGAASGPVIRPGDPDASLLLQVLTGEKPRMPKAGPPLTPTQIAAIRQWIEQGALDDSKGGSAGETWWSLRPLNRPTVLAAANHPIDAFLLDKLRASGLVASPEADRRTLARRVYYDLHGLPPTPEEVDAFVNDQSPGAYEKLIDRLLASSRYGERWARHWLDVIHYGDSHGYDKDKPRLHAWPYRDYVIAAFNEDTPWDRFVREQIAGDVLFPQNPRAEVATGFLAAGPWDFVGHEELREGTTEKDNTRLLDRDDMVATTISSFNSMTAHCARCHDHKFDPIPQEDYYSLQAVFAGIDRADRPYDDDPAIYVQRQQLLHQKQSVQIRLQPLLDKVEFADTPEIVDLDSAIQDAGLQIAHIGEPKTAADTELKKQLEARRAADRKRRQVLVDAFAGAETYAAIERIKTELKPIDAQLNALPAPKYVYAAASYFPRAGTFRPPLQPRPVFVLARGSVQSPTHPAAPGALRCVTSLRPRFTLSDPMDEGARRAALADWIASRENVLTWRSIVNRVWHYHFGAGLVDTPNDFGRMGSKPSHPELLDWLAVWFRDDAHGSLKALHKLILTSAAYRQQSRFREDAARVDAENRLLWRMNPGRLDAESIRDSILQIAGRLDLTMGGPGARWFYFKDDHSPVYDYSRYDPDSEGAHRRSIYRFIVRSVPDPFMERLDCPDPSVLTPKRSTTLTAIQALAMLNNPFVVRMAEHFASRLRESSDPIREAARLTFGRDPSDGERRELQDYAGKHGLKNLCRLLWNTNEFLFIE